MIKKNEILKKLWNFSWYKFKIFYIKNYQIDSIIKSDNWIIIQLNSLSNTNNLDYFKNNKYLKKLIDNNKVINLEKKHFENWFEQNKNSQKKYLIINDANHCKYEYRYIRYNGYEVFLIKKEKTKNH